MEHRAAEIHAGLKHPVIDGDGHWMEPIPVFLEYLREVGGAASVDQMRALWRRNQRVVPRHLAGTPAQAPAAHHLVGRHEQYARQGDGAAAGLAERAPA